MKISEIFRSIQGESTYAGLPCTFIRTAGCSLGCRYCDTKYAWDRCSGKEYSLDEILCTVQNLGPGLVEVTGGEPLEQEETPDLCRRLLERQSTVLIETSGVYPINILPKNVIVILDIKTPSSGIEKRNFWDNLKIISSKDELKFVIATRADFEWATEICRRFTLYGKCPVLFSPVLSTTEPKILAQWILEEKIPVRMQLQLHKIIWPPDTRGV